MSNLDENWNKILVKIHKIRNFWNLLHLSTPGKINIIKTYFYSQLSYIGTILNPPQNFIDSFESCIISFLKQGAKISKHRIFLDVDKGGLGLTPPLVFIESLKVNVFLKGMKSNDTWGIELRSKLLLKDCPHSIVPDSLNPRLNPILHILATSFNKFCNKFWLTDGNTMNAYIMANQLFVNQNGERLDESFFHGETWNRYKQIIKYLPLKVFLDENTNRFINFNNFCTVNNIRLSYNEFFRLQHIFRPYVNKYKRILCNFSSDLNKFLMRPNLKSKCFRPFFIEKEIRLEQSKPSKTRYLWSGIPIEVQREERFVNVWNLGFLPINIREFAFKFLNNLLCLNSNLAHFSDINPACTMCILSRNLPPQKENYLHFFGHCPTNTNILLQYFNTFFSNTNILWDSSFILIGTPSFINYSTSVVINVEIILVAHFIFQCRLKKKLPLLNNLNDYMKSHRKILLLSSRYNKSFSKWTHLFG